MSFINHLLILLWKCWIIRRRNIIISIFELLMPLVLAAFLSYNYNGSIGSQPNNQSTDPTIANQSISPTINSKPTLDVTWKDISSKFCFKDIYYTPSDPFIDDWMKVIEDLCKTKIIKMKNSYDIRVILTNNTYYNPIGLIVNSNLTKQSMNLSYTLMSSLSPIGTFDKLYERDATTREAESALYRYPQLCFYQILINEALLIKVAKDYNKTKYEINSLKAYQFPYPPNKTGKSAQAESTGNISWRDAISVTIIIGYLIMCPLIVKRITDEKSNKSKELLRMMGMSDWMFWSSHFVNYLIIMSVHALIFTYLFCFGIGKGNAIFNQINPILFFAILFIYCIQMILFCMSFTTVFNRPVIGVIVMTITYILSYALPLWQLHPIFGKVSTTLNIERLISSIIPSLGLTWSLALASQWHKYGENIGIEELFKKTSYYGNITIAYILVIQIFSCFLYSFLIWYLDAVWPFQYGVPKPFYFPCLPSYYCSKKYDNDIESAKEELNFKNSNFETEPKDCKTSIRLKNVSKEFGGGKGVHKVSFNIYSHQITILLGHNGAGKTTTMNMITGIYPPTSGTIHVNEYNIVSATNKARSSLGLCPQENIIFNDLTVREHLKLYAILKDCPCSQVETEINRVLDILRLKDKKNTKCTKLSGGMKRKLCLGIAMIGGTEILILDEPTSGMDPEARRAVWDVLQEVRKQKTILLTTHYMEEADVLGDRIAIMSEGRIKCCGSSIYLKKQFGAGYHLRISKSADYKKQLVESVLKRHLPESELQSEINIEVIYSLESQEQSKQTNRKKFPELFDELDTRKKELGIDSYGISVTTMEDVFLKVGSDVESDKKVLNDDKEINTEANTWNKLSESELFKQRVCGLLLKRFHFARRYWPMLLFQILIPAILLILTLLGDYGLRYSFAKLKISLELDLQRLYGSNTFGFFNAFDKNWEQFSQTYVKTGQRHGMNVSVISIDNPNVWLLDKAKNFEQYITKYIIGGVIRSASKLFYDINFWYNSEALHSLPISVNMMYESLFGYFIPEIKDKVRITTTISSPMAVLEGFMIVTFNFVNCFATCSILMPILTPFLGSSYILYPIQEQQSKSKFLQLMTGLSSFTFWFCNFLSDIFNHLLATILLFFVFYYFDFNRIFFYETDSIVALFLLLLLFGFCSIPIAYCFSFLFKQSTTGFTMLVVIYLFFGFIANLIITINHIMGIWNKSGKFLSFYTLILSLLRVVPIFSMNFGITKLYLIGSGKLICRQLDRTSNMTQRCLQDFTVYYCCDYSKSKLNITLSDETANFKVRTPFSFESYGIAMELIFMLLSGILFFILLMIIEGNVTKYMSTKEPNLNIFSNPSEDPDVLAERERVDQLVKNGKTSEEAVVVINLTKFFGNFRAVNHLSFSVHKNECFGLLGINGAGKTTAFSMLTGDMASDDGNAFIESLDLRTNTKLFQRRIGYCPQFDALLDRLTGEEMLYLFARLRGIPSKNIKREVKNLIQMTDLCNHSKSLTMVYSGGNKRKLSLGLSIVGNPSLIFLDEPTAGVDPVARRKIWRTLEFLKNYKNSSIILTSHSMEESEALCARIAIMVGGEFKCLGATQQLRSKFGQGFTLVVKLKPELVTDKNYITRVQKYIEQHLPSSQLKDRHENLLHYHITDTTAKWSSLFQVMESGKQELNLEDYSLSDTTLEQIFLSFARNR